VETDATDGNPPTTRIWEQIVQRNIARAYDALWAEHERIRALCAKILAQADRRLERRFLRPNPDELKHQDEVLRREDRLPQSELRRVLQLNAYGQKIETILGSLMKFGRTCSTGRGRPVASRPW
jgi:hypothetical protein